MAEYKYQIIYLSEDLLFGFMTSKVILRMRFNWNSLTNEPAKLKAEDPRYGDLTYPFSLLQSELFYCYLFKSIEEDGRSFKRQRSLRSK